jgi:S1-C subfamily serine protease
LPPMAPDEGGESPAAPRWSERLLPRTALGMSVLLLFTALGAAFSGAILYAYYEYRLDRAEQNIDRYVQGFPREVSKAKRVVQKEREDAKEQIRNELEPLQRIAPGGETLKDLLDKTGPSVWFVETVDERGAPSVGSGFVAFSDDRQTFLLTSFAVVRAASANPAPAIQVSKGNEKFTATLFTWQEDKDLALLTIDKGGTGRLEWASADSVKVGDRIFSVSGLGGSGGAIAQGLVADVSGSAIQNDAPVGAAFRGGPLINSNGEVVAVASRDYSPSGFSSEGVFFGIPIRASCEQVLRCPDSGAPGAGEPAG